MCKHVVVAGHPRLGVSNGLSVFIFIAEYTHGGYGVVLVQTVDFGEVVKWGNERWRRFWSFDVFQEVPVAKFVV